jgi:hypothetical protein
MERQAAGIRTTENLTLLAEGGDDEGGNEDDTLGNI